MRPTWPFYMGKRLKLMWTAVGLSIYEIPDPPRGYLGRNQRAKVIHFIQIVKWGLSWWRTERNVIAFRTFHVLNGNLSGPLGL